MLFELCASFVFKGWQEARPVDATVDPADIRGLVTTLLVSVRRLPLSRDEGLGILRASSRVASNRGCASC